MAKNEMIFMDGTIRTPEGEANWVKLYEPDTRFGPGKYTIDIIFDTDSEEYKKFVDSVAAFETKCGNKCKVPSVIKEKDGITFIKPGRKAEKGVVPIVGPDKLPFDGVVQKGDTVRAALGIAYYQGFGGGTTAYLQAIQVIAKGDGSDYGVTSAFDVEGDSLTQTVEPEVEEMPF